MKKICIICLFLIGLAPTLFAQDSASQIKTKKLNHTVGIQINELIRQVFNFNNSTSNTALNNPYLLTYNLNSVKSGWGSRLGLGYTYRSFTDDDGITRKVTDVNNLQFRIGVEKAFNLSEKWTAGVGADFLFSTDYSKTNTVTKSFDTTTIIIRSDVTRTGGGAMSWIRYAVNRNIQIGTEASFYYLSGDQSQRISITQRDFNQPGSPQKTTVSNTTNKSTDGSLRLPVAFYLLVRF